MTSHAALFPGQGSQFVGMGSRFLATAAGREIYASADAALDFSLSALSVDGPAEELTLTANAQPALLTHGYAAFAVDAASEGAPESWTALAGHSLGEWTAYVASGVLSLEDAVRLVRLRGKLMQGAVAPGLGAMSALIGLDEAVVAQICADAAESEIVSPATFNAPGQIVVSGHVGAVARAELLATEAGALKVSRLDVSAPFHCALMAPARAPLRDALAAADLRAPTIPVCSTVDVSWPETPDDIRRLLVDQLVEPTRWNETVRAVVDRGVEELRVLGAAASLARSVKRLRTGATVVARTEEKIG